MIAQFILIYSVMPAYQENLHNGKFSLALEIVSVGK